MSVSLYINKNYYMAKVFARRCRMDIHVNDIPVIRSDVEGDLSTTIPINYLIESSGTQNVCVQISPLSAALGLSASSECEVEIWRYDGSVEPMVRSERACTVSLTVGKAEQALPLKRQYAVFNAEVPYQISRWSDCERLENSRVASSEVAGFYQRIWKMLNEKQYDKYLGLIRKRELDICKALLLDESELDVRNQMFFECLNGGFELCPMKGKKILEFYADRKVVAVLDEDFRSVIRFRNPETGEILVVDLFAGRKKGENNLSII